MFQLGPWQIEPRTGRITRSDETSVLEPKLMSLLTLLASQPGQVFARTDIETALWANVVVNEDTVARAISRLRRALGDSAREPSFIETLPKRGYRLIAPVVLNTEPDRQLAKPASRHWPWSLAVLAAAIVVLVATLAPKQAAQIAPVDVLTDRANDAYMQFTRAENESAIVLYERALALDANHAGAQAGLANALVQRVVRWPYDPQSPDDGASTLTAALEQGLTTTPAARETLARASAMAERAVRLAPNDPAALKSLAFTVTANGDLSRAKQLYRRTIDVDQDAWAAMINLGEIHLMEDQPRLAIEQFEHAFAAMGRSYDWEPQRVGPWQAALGVQIGKNYESLSQPQDAEIWYRRVLDLAPLEPEATTRLAALLRDAGDPKQAAQLCRGLVEKIGAYTGCSTDIP